MQSDSGHCAMLGEDLSPIDRLSLRLGGRSTQPKPQRDYNHSFYIYLLRALHSITTTVNTAVPKQKTQIHRQICEELGGLRSAGRNTAGELKLTGPGRC